jgi:hypothetical protein
LALGLSVMATWALGWSRPRPTEYWHWRPMPARPPGDAERNRERQGWWVLAGLLVLGGVAGPDTLGATHGEYLQQRIVLLGLVALMPVLRFDADRWSGRVAAVALGVAVCLQTAFVWDYARTAERRAGAILRAAGAIGTHQRVVPRLTGIRTRFRANPLLHADGLVGVGTGNVLWADYETRFYYFPVHFRAGLDHPDPFEFERIALMDEPADAGARALRWSRLLEQHHRAIDVVLAWGDDPALDAITTRWYHATYADGLVRVFQSTQNPHP